jgi:hypothetical protein
MSLLDFILGQKTIIISLGIAALLFALAVMIGIIITLRQWLSRRRAQAALRQAALDIAEDQADQPDVVPHSEPSRPPAVTVAQGQPAPITNPQSRPASPLAAQLTPTAAPQPEAQTAEPVSSAMQDILTSLFASEESSERQQALLRGLDDVDITQLTTLCHQIATQLGARGAYKQGA